MLLDESFVELASEPRAVFAIGYFVGYEDAVNDIADELPRSQAESLFYHFVGTKKTEIRVRGLLRARETRL